MSISMFYCVYAGSFSYKDLERAFQLPTAPRRVHSFISLYTMSYDNDFIHMRIKLILMSGSVGCVPGLDETLSREFDISSQLKQKLRTKRRRKILKIYAN